MHETTDIHYMSIDQVGREYRTGNLSPVDVTVDLLQRIDKIDPILRSYTHVAHEYALKSAKLAERELSLGMDRGNLHGIPIALKDIFFTDFMPTEAGMVSVPTAWRTGSATVVDRAVAAGAVVLGTVATTEGAWSGYNRNHDAPLNPWGHEWWSGASSSGPAVATAAGLCFAALGSDTGGSIRFPAAACGITGLKPTWGRVPRAGVVPLSPSLDHIGPFARSARDSQLLLAAVEGYDPRDPTSSRVAVSSSPGSTHRVRGIRIGVDDSYVGDLPPAAADAFNAFLEELASLGARIVSVSLPDYRPALDAWRTIVATEASVSHASTFPSRREDYGSDLAALLDDGRSKAARDVITANLGRIEYQLAVADVFESVDLYACPVMIGLLPTVNEWLDAADEHAGSIPKFTSPHDLAGIPTITIPGTPDGRGAPIGLQLCAGQFGETLLTEVASALQSVTDWHLRRPTV